MKKNIIIGNGVNIQFDKSNNDWTKLGIICQEEFKDHVYKLNKNNVILNQIYKTFQLIEKYIDKEKFINLEDYVKFFNIFHYKEIMSEIRFKIFFCILWNLLNDIFDQKVITESSECPNISSASIVKSIAFLNTLENVYKKIFKNVIINIYQINQIKIDKKFIKYINKNFEIKITLNYDNNLKDVKNLIHLHGKFDHSLIKWSGNLEKHQKNIINLSGKNINPKHMKDYLEWSNKNVIHEDLILRNKSSLKSVELSLLSYIKENGFENLLSNFGLENENIDFTKVKIDNSIKNYEENLNLKGKVILIGINPNNDELILEILKQNTNIKKIIIYGEKDYIFNDRIEYKHFSKFWKIIEKYNTKN